jgi:hypothetical protein
MKRILFTSGLAILLVAAALFGAANPAQAQDKKPNVLILMTDDTGWNPLPAMDPSKPANVRAVGD